MSDKMMEVPRIKFDSKGNNAPTYSCNKPGDNSGTYVQATDYDEVVNRVKVLEEALRELVYDINLKHGINIENMVGVSTRACLERARKALEADNG